MRRGRSQAAIAQMAKMITPISIAPVRVKLATAASEE
jgi:hypothetical protein